MTNSTRKDIQRVNKPLPPPAPGLALLAWTTMQLLYTGYELAVCISELRDSSLSKYSQTIGNRWRGAYRSIY